MKSKNCSDRKNRCMYELRISVSTKIIHLNMLHFKRVHIKHLFAVMKNMQGFKSSNSNISEPFHVNGILRIYLLTSKD